MARYYFNCTGGQTYNGSGAKVSTTVSGRGYVAGYSSAESEFGHRRSIALFNTSDIRNKLKNLRVTGCYLDYYVKDVFYTVATVSMGTHNYTAVPDVWSNSRVNEDRVRRSNTYVGQVYGMSLGAAIGAEFRDGVSTGIAFGPAPSNDNSYFYEVAPNGHWYEPVLIIDADNAEVNPYAPTLQEPAADKVLDAFGLGVSFRWTHNDPNGDAQSAWRFRRRTTVANGTQPDVFDWWNGTAFVATQTDLTTGLANGALVIPPGIWANNKRYEWSVATRDPSGNWGPYSPLRALYSSTPPVTTVVEPSARAKTARPTIRWNYADADGQAQYGWAAQVVEPAVYNDPTWNPDNYLRQVWSTSAENTNTAVAPGVDLRNHRTYRAYVKTASSPNPAGGLQWSQWAFSSFEVAVPPSASDIVYPDNGSVADLGNGFTLEWRNTFFGGVGSQTAFAIRRQLNGGPYQWWNGSAWVVPAAGAPTPYIPGSSSTYAFRPGEVPNGNTYTFSVSIRDDYNEVSPYSSGSTVLASSAAQVTVLAPTGITVVSNPTVTWTMYDIENDPQQTWQVRVIHQSVFGSGTIDPTTATAVWDSGEILEEGTRNIGLPVDLTNGETYRAYVRVTTNGIYSGWSYGEFRVSLVPPAGPTATTRVREDAAVDIIIQGRDSMLSEPSSRNFAAWDAGDNSTITNAVPFGSSQSGYASTLRSVAAGTMTAVTHEAWPAAAGMTYTAGVTFIAPVGVAAVNAYASIEFFDINGNLIGIVSGAVVSDESAVRSAASGVAPALTAYARVRVTYQNVTVADAGHMFFDPVLRPSSGAEWSPGGTLGNTFASVYEDTEDRALRYGLNVPIPNDTQRVTITDHEVRMGDLQTYRVTTRAVYPNAALVSLPQYLQPVRWVDGYVWLSDPLRPGSARSFGPQSFDATTRPVRQGKFRPIGRPDAVITTGVRGLREGGYTIVTHDRGTRDEYRELTDLTEVLLLRIPPDQGDTVGETLYVRLEGDAPEERPLAQRTPHRVIKQSWTEQRAPETGFQFTELPGTLDL
jgi:hypothetical protein